MKIETDNVTVVIPHRRSIELLWATYASARICGLTNFVIVCNGRERDKLHDKFMAEFLFFKEGLGPARAREEGARLVKTEWIFFLDDDSICPNGFLDDVPDTDCVFFGSTCWNGVRHYDLPVPDRKILDVPAQDTPSSKKPYPTYSGAAGSVLIKREIWEKMNGYRGLLDGYGPDEWLMGHCLDSVGALAKIDPRFVFWHFPSYESYKNRDEEFLKRYEMVRRMVCYQK